MRKSSLLFAVATATVLLASAPVTAGEANSGNQWRQVAYNCDSGQELTIAFRESGSSVRVTAPENPMVKLNARPAKSGFRFSDSRHELRGEVDSVTWKIGSRAPIKCSSEDPAAATLAATASR